MKKKPIAKQKTKSHLSAKQRALLKTEASDLRAQISKAEKGGCLVDRLKAELKDTVAELKGLPTFGRPRFPKPLKGKAKP